MHFLVSILLCAAPGPLALLPIEKADLKATQEGAEKLGADADRISVWPPAKGTTATLLVFFWNADPDTRQLLIELSALYAEQRANGLRVFALDDSPSADDLKLLPQPFPVLFDDAEAIDHFACRWT